MNKQLIFMLGIITLMMVMPIVFAETENVKVDINTTLKFTCTLNDAIPSNLAKFIITISYPNGTTFINNVTTTPYGSGAFKYNAIFPEVGTYKVQMFCYDGTYSNSKEGFYDITGNGKSQPEGITIVLFSIVF